MRRRLPYALLAALLSLAAWTPSPATAQTSPKTDYPPANWVPASPNNYTVSNRPRRYNVDMIVIHDTEGSYAAAIAQFQDPNRAASAHYVISQQGDVTQMVLEKDVAWHAGNWDYNTRAIGIEHEGYAYVSGSFTTAEYRASEQLAASICSRWGVPLDRAHVIGHNEVPDPDNPGLYGGSDHHTDPGPYWDWTNYLDEARKAAALLPSPPHIGPAPAAAGGDGQATVSWHPAHTCHEPVSGYTVVEQPDGITQTVGATATSATFTGLTNGVRYTFSVTTQNKYGSDTLQSNSVIPSLPCTSPAVTAGAASPQPAGSIIQFSATASACTNPQYEFWLEDPSGNWRMKQSFGGASWTWDSHGFPLGTYTLHAWANQETTDESTWQSYAELKFTIVAPPPCSASTIAPASSSQASGSTVSFTATSGTCITPLYAFWLQDPSGTWSLQRPFSTDATWAWNTAGWAPGSYTIHVWANQQGDSTATWESYASASVALSICTSASLSPTSVSQPAGGMVQLTASSSGCATPQYEYWVQSVDGTWKMIQGWGGATFSWNTAGLTPGTYTVHVWANNQGDSTARWEAYGSASVTLTGCTSASLSPPSGSSSVGTQVAFTATSAGCANPVYEFWLQYPDGTWHMVQAFSPSSSWTWNTPGLAKGNYVIHVWANQQGTGTSRWQAYAESTYTLT
jgi:N-acetyl-anhydromuramyl-L-alanine amidase AmpD